MNSPSQSQPISTPKSAVTEAQPSAAPAGGNVLIMAEGLCYLSACAPSEMEGPEVEASVRRQRVSGTSRGWLLSDDPTFSGGQINPCECDQDPSRRHWLLEC